MTAEQWTTVLVLVAVVAVWLGALVDVLAVQRRDLRFDQHAQQALNLQEEK